MAFNITEFKSTLGSFGGTAHAGLFEVTIQGRAANSSQITPRQLTFFCKTMSIPGITINTATYEQTAKLSREMPTGIANNPVNGIFLIDADHQILKFFHSWAQNVVNYSTAGGELAEVNGMLPFEVAYREDYAATIIIKFYNPHPTGPNNTYYETVLEGAYREDYAATIIIKFYNPHPTGPNNTYYETVLEGAFPTAIGEIDLSWENNDSYATLPVSFSYDKVRFTGEVQGSPTSRFNRGTGLLSFLNSVGSLTSVIGQGLKFNSVQDAANRLLKFRNSWDNITNFFR